MNAIALQALTILVLMVGFQPARATDVSRAENLFRAKCAQCHSIACNRLGPKLEGVFGRRAGSVVDYKNYTEELKNSGIVWSDDTLDAFIRDPGKLVPGTSMTGAGQIEGAKDRRDIVRHIRRQDKRIDLCF